MLLTVLADRMPNLSSNRMTIKMHTRECIFYALGQEHLLMQ
jgi:hypothetical protein